ncbi:MAG: hypothetical protein WD069_14910 [Planctomycetales bacterium]
MKEDPIVAEVREARRRIFEACGSDLDRLIAHLKDAESKHKERLVTIEDVQRRRQAGQAAL